MRFKEGDAVVYEKTGTQGHITKIIEMDGKTWAELDATGLLYDENVLEPTETRADVEPLKKKEGKASAKEEEVEIMEEALKEGDLTVDTSGSCSGAG
ncbi:MAG: DUF2098 family protein [Candidatus Methanosuratus sp.]|nr:DUF2098 family protein [Candidatus Methanosuratincola sp.]